jgi:hypothetical protein
MAERDPVGPTPNLDLTIAGEPNASPTLEKFEWWSFVNGGYQVRATLKDESWNILTPFIKKYLEQGRKEPTPITWVMSWSDPDIPKFETDRRTAYISSLRTTGIGGGGEIEFIAMDPPSYFLNTGNASGNAFRGSDLKGGDSKGGIRKVVQQVVNKYARGRKDDEVQIELDMDDTDDSEEAIYYMMRQDPKTFIMSLLEWSASMTEDQTNWLIASVDEKLVIKKQATLVGEEKFGSIVVTDGPRGSPRHVREFEYLGDNYITNLQTKLVTQGISATSELYLDKEFDESINDMPNRNSFAIVADENTEKKKRTLDPSDTDRGFTKPEPTLNGDLDDKEALSTGGTSVLSVPEFSAGDTGIPYERYMDGTARHSFLRMLPMINRIKIRMNGFPRLDDSSKLGPKCELACLWLASCNGTWRLVYGCISD